MAAPDPSAGAHIIVCGLHDVGLRVIEQLHLAGERVVVVDDDPDARLLRAVVDWGVPHLPSSARRAATLHEAGIDTAAALICTAERDLDNLEVALLAHRLRADLRVVVQLGNAALGRAVARVTGPGTVLDVAALAAPTLAEACLDLREREVRIADQQFVLREVTAPQADTLRAMFGDLVPIAVVPRDDTDMHVCPGRDLAVAAGDRVVLLGTADDFAEQETPRHTTTRQPRWGTIRRYVRGFVAETDRPLRLTLAALLTVALLSILLLQVGYNDSAGRHMTFLDAVYFTTETLTTVGFGDFYFADQPTWLRIWAIVLMIIGAAVVTVLYAMLTNLLVSRRIAQSLGRQVATRMSEHVIVVGLGTVGLGVVERLVAAGQPVVVLDRDEDNRFLGRARALRVPIVFGDSTVAASLDAANLRGARAIAVLSSSDLTNVETGLAALDLLGDDRADVPVVLRVFDRSLADTLEDSFGFRSVRSTAALAAPWFVGAALGLDILQTFYVDQQPMLIGRLTVGASGGLQGRTMLELSARIRVIAIARHGRADLEYPPRRDTRFEGGDRAYLVGTYEELLGVLRRDSATSAR